MTETLSADEAIALLRGNPSQYATPQGLRELAAQVDADSSGRLTVLYSGPAAKDIWSTDVINAMRVSSLHFPVPRPSERNGVAARGNRGAFCLAIRAA